MPPIRSVTVYAASAPEAPSRFRDAARDLGAGIAARGWLLVYGGANIGLMGEVADAALAHGGRVEGIILDTFARVAHERLHVLDTVGDMRSRKAALAHRGDAFVTLPGGFGTLEELSEILVERQLGFHEKPLVLVDVDGFWQPLLTLIERQIAHGLVRPAYRDLITVVPDAEGALAALDAAVIRPPAASSARDLGKLERRG
jgi:uncharacterized protein (TIGR00730 family)